MSGTWLQEGYYGSLHGAGSAGTDRRPQTEVTMSDEQLIATVSALPAVASARRLKCVWVVVTAVFREPLSHALPPSSHAPLDPACWVAFVDRAEHRTPGWNQAILTIFSEYERNANAVKVMAPLLFPHSGVFYLDPSLTRARCFSFDHLVRAKELTPSNSTLVPHLFASAIPSWSGRSSVAVQLDLTQAFIRKRQDARAERDFDALTAAMRDAGFNASSYEKRQIPDTLFLAWPPTLDGVPQRLSRLWFHEIARRSAYEKASYAWAASKVPELRKLFTNAVYVYSPEQRWYLLSSILSNLHAPLQREGVRGHRSACMARARSRWCSTAQRGQRMVHAREQDTCSHPFLLPDDVCRRDRMRLVLAQQLLSRHAARRQPERCLVNSFRVPAKVPAVA